MTQEDTREGGTVVEEAEGAGGGAPLYEAKVRAIGTEPASYNEEEHPLDQLSRYHLPEIMCSLPSLSCQQKIFL